MTPPSAGHVPCPPRRRRRAVATAILALPCLSAAACVFTTVGVRDVKPANAADSLQVSSPVKAHLLDGTTVVYPNGLILRGGRIHGAGTRHALGTGVGRPSGPIVLDSVAAMESYQTETLVAPTVLGTIGALAIGAVAVAGLAVAAFGSCPTIYSDSTGVHVLEAEGFSYSIAPLFERRDVDRLRAAAAADGVVRLEVRNEALETHYLNHFELLEVRHAAGEHVAPDGDGLPLVLGGLRPAARVTDRSGRDVSAALREADGVPFATATATLAAARADDLEDHLDVTIAAPAGADSMAVLLRLRNSLLNTVLLYDEILGASGARSLDWLSRDLGRIGDAVAMARWYGRSMGLRVAVRDGDAWRPVGRVGDAGPIAFHDVAIVVPAVRTGDSVRVRLSFTADNWRIDRLAVAAAHRAAAVRALAPTSVVDADERADTAALASVREPDEAYLSTTPGQRFTLRFDAGRLPPGATRTFLLASQGYYVEWVRGAWLATATRTTPFVPSDDALYAALRRWREVQPDFERRFYASKIPVR